MDAVLRSSNEIKISCIRILQKMEQIGSDKVKISVIKEGYAYLDPEGWMRANCSCTLVQTPESTVIVDTLTPWDASFILEQLKSVGVAPQAVTHVISTHGHSDHNGNNNLFLSAKYHIVGYCVSNRDVYYTHPFDQDEPFVIDPHLKVISTPGHTSEDVSLIVSLTLPSDRDEIVAIAGDLFESEKDLLDPSVWTANSFSPEIQIKNRVKVLNMARRIIPGHGKMFTVQDEHVKAAELLATKYEEQGAK